MRKTLLLFACLVFSLEIYGEDVKCKCNEVPFEPDPPCAKACIVSIIKYSDFKKLVTGAGLSLGDKFVVNNLRTFGMHNHDEALLGRNDGCDYCENELRKIEVKLYFLPSDQLKAIVKTLPGDTILIPKSRVMDYKLDKSLKNHR